MRFARAPRALVPTEWSVAAGQSIGRREEQQDSHGRGAIRLDDGEVAPVFVVVDGMGGEVGGRLAAETAVAAFLSACEAGTASDIALRLRDALLAANAAVAGRAAEEPGLSGMGCTLVALALGRGRATWISVGDSLLLRHGPAGIERLNADHSMAPALDEAARAGEMSAEAAASHPQRSILLSALTGRAISLIDERSIRLDGNEQFLLASDGLLSLSGSVIAALAAGLDDPDPGRLVASLLAAVEAQGHSDQDNCTIVVVRGAAPVPQRRSRMRGVIFLAFGTILLVVTLSIVLWKWNGLGLAPAGVSRPAATSPAARPADVPRRPSRTTVADPSRARTGSAAAGAAAAKPTADRQTPSRRREKQP